MGSSYKWKAHLASIYQRYVSGTVAVRSSIADPKHYPTIRKTKTISPKVNLSSVKFVDEESGWGGGDTGSVYKTADGGETWRQVTLDNSPNAHTTSMEFADNAKGWVALVRYVPESGGGEIPEARLLHTDNGGEDWQEQYSGKFIHIGRIRFFNETEGWIVGTRAEKYPDYDYFVMHTSDGGKHWMDVSQNLNQAWTKRKGSFGPISDVHPDAPGAATLLTTKGQFLTTNNGGQKWALTETAVGNNDPQVSISNIGRTHDNRYWVSGGSGGVEGISGLVAKEDGRGAWERYVLDVRIIDSVYLPSHGIIACGTMPSTNRQAVWDGKNDGVVIYSNNNGRNWVVLYRSAEVDKINQLSFVDSGHVWAVGEGGLVLQLEVPGL